MQLYQFNFKYLPEEDRLLFRMTTTEKQVFLLLFTRRLVSRLADFLGPVLEQSSQATLSQGTMPTSERTKKAIAQFKHEQTVQNMDFNTPFQEDIKETPLGEKPLLIKAINIQTLKDAQYFINFITIENKSISLTINSQILHSLYHLLSKTAGTAEWDLAFTFQEVSTPNISH